MDKNYVAGFFDGEGSIMIDLTDNRKRLVVSITNTNQEVLNLFSEQYGGSVRVHTVKNRNAKSLFYWRLRDSSAMKFLEQIYDGVLIKARHITLAREFMNTDDIDRKLTIARNIKILNQRGKIKDKQLPL